MHHHQAFLPARFIAHFLPTYSYWLGTVFCVLSCLFWGTRFSSQTIEVVGSARAAINARVPVINDAGNVLYVNGNAEVMGNPTTPILKPLPATELRQQQKARFRVSINGGESGLLRFEVQSLKVRSSRFKVLALHARSRTLSNPACRG